MQYDTYFSQTYGACSYGGSSYQNSSCQSTTTTTTTTGSGSSSGSPLTNTGFDIFLIATIACALIFIALVIRLWRRPKKQPPTAKPPESPNN